jgi:AhpD family alkylhydroperoxidase
MSKIRSVAAVTAALAVGALTSGFAGADAESYATALQDVEQTFGFIPTFMQALPVAGFDGAWAQLKGLEFSEDTALDAKTKALISLAVVAQIPCAYCIWADSASARAAGATDEEIGEAVAIAATERYWSTMLNGLQIDMATFQQEMGPLFGGTAD